MQNIKPQKLSPEQQNAYTLIVKQAMSFLLDDEHLKAIIGSAKAGDPKEAVISACVPLIQNIFQAAKNSGAQVDTVTVLAASIEIIGNVSEMLATVGIIQESEIPKFAGEVARIAVTRHNENATRLQGQRPSNQTQGAA